MSRKILLIENKDSLVGKHLLKLIEVSNWEVDVLDESQLNSPVTILAKSIAEDYSYIDLFLINVNIKASNEDRSSCFGIKILKFIRLYGLHQHCILYSFLSRESLIQLSPENLILFSEGLSFYQLPNEIQNYIDEKIFTKKAPDDLSRYLKAESRLPDDRHFVANWWGVVQLCKIHRVVAGNNQGLWDDEIENSITNSLNGYDSYQGLLARYLNRKSEQEIDIRLNSLKERSIERFGDKQRDLELINKVLKQKTEEYNQLTLEIDILKEALSERENQQWFLSVLEKLKFVSGHLEAKFNNLISLRQDKEHDLSILKEYIELTDLIEKEKHILDDRIKVLDKEINNSISDLENLRSFSTSDFSLGKSRNQLISSKPRILYVDDQADEGWAHIFQYIIYDKIDESDFRVIQPVSSDSIEHIVERILFESQHFIPELLILDLRLRGETGNIDKTNEISGIQVLERLRKAKLNCPILVSTASNKSWSFRETLSIGASAFWTKEGLDDKFSLSRTVDNYLHFVDMVTVLTQSKEFQYLKEYNEKVHEIQKNPGKFWWEETNRKALVYALNISNATDRTEIMESLWDVSELLHDYLKIQLFTNTTADFARRLPSLIAMRLASVLEIIHKPERGHSDSTLKMRMKDRIGSTVEHWKNLIELRNSAVHEQNTTFADLKAFAELLFKYLKNFEETMTIVGKIDLQEKASFNKKGAERFNSVVAMDLMYISTIKDVKQSIQGERYYLIEVPLKYQPKDIEIRCYQGIANPKVDGTLKPGDEIKFKIRKEEKAGAKPRYLAIETVIIKNR